MSSAKAFPQPFPIVLMYDPAIDAGRCSPSLYCNERDIEQLKYYPGERPTVYWGRHLNSAERQEIGNMPSEFDRYRGCFVRGLVRVERLVHDDGQTRDWSRPDDMSGKSKPIPNSILDTYFDEAAIQEIGMVIYHSSFLARTKGRFYPLLATSQLGLVATYVRRAGLTSDSLTAASPSSPAEGAPDLQPQSSQAGDASTGAIATAPVI